MKEKDYSEASISTRIQDVRTVVNWAITKGYVNNNVFSKVKKGSTINKKREHFISREDYQKLLNACPGQTWRTLITLCRIGGLRNPSETSILKWEDINWENGRVTVHSPKTEHHKNKGSRIIPLFRELREELEKQRIELPDPEFVINNKFFKSNNRNQLKKIIENAKLEVWPRIFHNFRGSRSNELFSEFPAHVASEWLGQSLKVAQEHYLHAIDDYFDVANKE